MKILLISLIILLIFYILYKVYGTIRENMETDKKKDDDKLIESLQIKRYCCKMRVITYKNKTEIFK